MIVTKSSIGQFAFRGYTAFLALFCVGIVMGSDPASNLEKDILRIQELLTAGNLDAATAALDQDLRQYPNEGGLYNLRGIVQAQRGDLKRAEEDFQAAIRLSPRLEGSYLNLGRLYELQANGNNNGLASAVEIYRRGLRVDPSLEQVRLQLTKILLWQADFSGSLAVLAKMPSPESDFAKALRMTALVGLHRDLEADRISSGKLHLTESEALDIAPALLSHGRAEFLQKLLIEAGQRQALSPRGQRVLGEAESALGHKEQAKTLLTQSAQADPESPEPLLDLAKLAWDEKQYQTALGYVAHARDLAPDRASIHFFFGVICIAMDLPVEARKAVEHAIQLDPSNAYYHYALGGIELQSRLPGEAKAQFEKYLALQPGDARAHLAIGAALFEMAEYDAAKTELLKAGSLGGAQYYLGRVARAEGDAEEAVRYFSKALDQDPNCIECYAERGRAEIQQKDYAGATRDLQVALKQSPENVQANEYLLLLYQKTNDPRAEAQRTRFAEVNQKHAEKQQQMLRRLDIRPTA